MEPQLKFEKKKDKTLFDRLSQEHQDKIMKDSKEFPSVHEKVMRFLTSNHNFLYLTVESCMELSWVLNIDFGKIIHVFKN